MKSCVFAVLSTYLLISGHACAQAYSPMPNGDPRWQRLDGQYARIERATVANNAQQLFAVYAPDFEAHMFNGEVWSFKRDQDLRSHRRPRMAGRQSPWTPVGASIRALRGCKIDAGARGIVPTLVLVSELVQSSR